MNNNKKISDLLNGAPVLDSDLFVIARAGIDDYKLLATEVLQYFINNLPTPPPSLTEGTVNGQIPYWDNDTTEYKTDNSIISYQGQLNIKNTLLDIYTFNVNGQGAIVVTDATTGTITFISDGNGGLITRDKETGNPIFEVSPVGEVFVYNGTSIDPVAALTTTAFSLNNGQEFRFYRGINYVGFKAPASLSEDTVYSLPTADGSPGQVLTTDGSKILYWKDDNSSLWEIDSQVIPYNYGLLYNWPVINSGLLAPDGWRIPTHTDATLLISYVDSLDGTGVIKSGSMKSIRTTVEPYYNTPNTGALDNFSMYLLPGGVRESGTGFILKNEHCILATSTSFDATLFRCFSAVYTSKYMQQPVRFKIDGVAVRCMRDATVDEQLLADGTYLEEVQDYDGNWYKSIKIGIQVWLNQNLKVTHYNDGTAIPHITDDAAWANDTTGAYCVYNNDALSDYEDPTYTYTVEPNLIRPKNSKKVHISHIEGGQAAIPYTAEDSANKTDVPFPASSITYPSTTGLHWYVDEMRLKQFCGQITTSDVAITHTGGGYIDIGQIQVNLNTEADFTGNVNTYVIPTLTGAKVTENTYTYITVNYNAGNPEFQLITDNTLINHSTILNIAQVYWEVLDAVDEFHIFRSGAYGNGLANKIGHRLLHTERFGYESGLQLSEYGTRNIRIESGKLWYDGSEFSTLLVTSATSGHEVHHYYPVSSAWHVAKVTQYPNTQYNNGTDLASLTGNKYCPIFVFKAVNTDFHDSYIVLGNEYNSIAESLQATMPTLPDIIVKQAKFVGRIVIKNGDSVASRVTNELTLVTGQTPAVNHNDTANRDAADSHPTSAITGLDAALSSKQATLVSGTNIKTINSTSLLGSGDIAISATNTLLTGLAGGQTAIGGTAASENLTLRSTAHATKGKVIVGSSAFDEVNNRFGIGTITPTGSLDVPGIANSIPTISLGANLGGVTRTNATAKYSCIAAYPYTNAGNQMAVITTSSPGNNEGYITIGSADGNFTGFYSPTAIQFYTNSGSIGHMVGLNFGLGGISFTPAYLLTLKYGSNRTFGVQRNVSAQNGNDLNIVAGGGTASSPDKDAGILYLGPYASGQMTTGTGITSTRIRRSARASSTSPSDNSTSDALIIPSEANLTDNTAVSLFEVALASNSATGGHVDFTILCSDGTDFQSYTGKFIYAAVNKAATITANYSESVATAINSTGTLTTTWSVDTATAGKITIKVNANSSLTPTSFKINYSIFNGGSSAITQL